jgi:hypothetical protein
VKYIETGSVFDNVYKNVFRLLIWLILCKKCAYLLTDYYGCKLDF